MKIAVVTDSNCSIPKEYADKLGISIVPMPFMIDGETYYEDVNLTQAEFYEKQAADCDITTSQPSPEYVMNLWDELLKTNDQIVHIPMSSGLSGSCETAMMLASDEKYEGKAFVVDEQRVSVTQAQAVYDALLLADKGHDGAEIRKCLEDHKFDSVIYITVDTLKYLKKGGRITPTAAALGTLLKIKPVLTILGEKLDAFAKVRTMKQAKSTMITALQKDMEQKLHDPEGRNTHIAIAHTQNLEAAEEFRDELLKIYPYADCVIAALPLSIACHIGPGSLAVAATTILDEERDYEKEIQRLLS